MPLRMLLVHENVQHTPDDWSPVLQWHAHDTHILFMCRGPGDLRKLKFEADVAQVCMPRGLHEKSEFPEVVDRLLQSLPHVSLDGDERARLYKLTSGHPLAVQLTVRSMGWDEAGSVCKVLSKLEKTGGFATNKIFAECIAQLRSPAQCVLGCLAQFEADGLPEALLEAVVEEVLRGGHAPGMYVCMCSGVCVVLLSWCLLAHTHRTSAHSHDCAMTPVRIAHCT